MRYTLFSAGVIVSRRSMYCSINSTKIAYGDIASANLVTHRDGTGTLTLKKVKLAYQPEERITFDRVRDVRGLVRVLAKVLPEEVAQDGGFTDDS